MKILVTGGAGFIGSEVIRHLINETLSSVINLDNLSYAGNLESLNHVESSSRYFFEKVDICDRSELKRIFNQYQPDIIMHLAAESHVDRSINSPDDFVQTNIIGTFALLEEARSYWQKLKGSKHNKFRFHHISTDEVYGDLIHPDDVNNNIDMVLPMFQEDSPYAPSSPYSASKASSDHLVRAWYRTYGLPILITNCSNNYGPYQFPEKLIPNIIISALNGRPLPVYGKGNQIRDWLYVEDHVKALILVAEQGKIGETYNIGGYNEKQNIEVVYEICSLLDELMVNKPNNIEHFSELIEFVEDRPGHDTRYAINASKIYNDLGWKPQEDFESGIKKTVHWYLNNESWINNIKQGKK
tara:strand:+ start:972 stop:2039 length:1068 start_codon:yes stop_codon:yes gene_type:complete